jgi:hypothetical protein
MATRHLTLRIDQASLDRLERESERTGQNRSELARQLIEEGLRMARHPGIVFRDGIAGRRPALSNGPQIWTLVSVWSDFEGTEEHRVNETAEYLNLSPQQVRAGLRYYAEFRGEIDAWIAVVDREAHEAYAAWQLEQAALAR